MTATTIPPIGLSPDLDIRGLRRFTTAVSDTFAVMARNLIAYRRVPQLLVFSTIQPVVFVLLFRYVFGGAISTPGVPYVDFLMPGIFAQTVAFAVGWRVHTGILPLLAAVLLVLLFGFALSWIFATVGLMVANPETAQAAAFPVMAPLVFASSAFVPIDSMPDWLQPFATYQPLSVVVAAVRDLTIGGETTSDVVQAILWCVAILAVAAPIAV